MKMNVRWNQTIFENINSFDDASQTRRCFCMTNLEGYQYYSSVNLKRGSYAHLILRTQQLISFEVHELLIAFLK